jgi:hypothetical protein
MALEAEFTPLLYQRHLFSRLDRLGMAHFAGLFFKGRMEIFPEESTIFGVMRVMTVDTVGSRNGIPQVDPPDFISAGIMTRLAQIFRSFDEICQVVRGMGIMAGHASTFFHERLVDLAAVEFFPIMARQTDLRTFRVKQFLPPGPMGIMTSTAIPPGQRGMDRALVQQLFDFRMACQAQLPLLLEKKTIPVPGMWVVAIRTGTFDYRHVCSLSSNLIPDRFVTACTEIIPLSSQ